MNGSVQKLISELEQRDIRLEVINERLRVNAPKGALTARLRQTLQDRKAELLKVLKDDWAADARRVIQAIPQESLRPALLGWYEASVIDAQRANGLTLAEAQKRSFGLLLFKLLELGIQTCQANTHSDVSPSVSSEQTKTTDISATDESGATR
jgi:hypothetical protein